MRLSTESDLDPRRCTWCKTSADGLTWGIAIDRSFAAQVYHLMKAELPAVD